MEHNSANKIQNMTAEYRMTKRAAVLLARVASQFPNGFVPELLAVSLGWSLDEVLDALETCVAYGLIAPPPGCDVPKAIPIRSSGRPLTIHDLLTPRELKAAKGTGHVHDV